MAKLLGGTRFTKAATPQGGSLNLTNRSLGGNARKQKLTEASGTNPSKLGGGLTVGQVGDRRYAQDTAPHKALTANKFSVGGPGFDDIQLKGFK
jgi:hypothetical protein